MLGFEAKAGHDHGSLAQAAPAERQDRHADHCSWSSSASAFAILPSLSPEQQEDLLWFVQDYLPIAMFLTLALLLFSGYPVAFILGGLALLYGLIGYALGVFSLIEFFNFLPRIWGQAAENLVLVSIPAFVFMGIMMERSGIAADLLYTVQVLLKRVPGALALAVTIMGTILAAMTGIIGASVTMMTALALPTMMRQGYSHALACGTIAASGTLGILIPPSIMLIIMADLMSVSVGNVYMAAWGPGLALVGALRDLRRRRSPRSNRRSRRRCRLTSSTCRRAEMARWCSRPSSRRCS